MALTKIKLDDVDPKATPVLSDEILISDSADGGRGKLVTGTALRALVGGGATIDPSGTDDTIALQAAIDAGGVVQLGAGTYIITSVNISNDVIIQGVGNDTVVKRKDGTLTSSGGDAINKMFTLGDFGIKVVFRDLLIDGNEANQLEGEVYGFTFYSQSNTDPATRTPLSITFSNVTFQNEACGVIAVRHDLALAEYAYLTVDNCRFLDQRRTGINELFVNFGITAYDYVNVSITNNRFIFSGANANDGDSTPVAIRLTCDDNVITSNATAPEGLISGNYIYRWGRGNDGNSVDVTTQAGLAAIDVYSRGKNLRIKDNHISEPYSIGIRCKSSSENTIITGNIIENSNYRGGIMIAPNNILEQRGKLIVSNNIISDVSYTGISVTGNEAVVGSEYNDQLYFSEIIISDNIINGVALQAINAVTMGEGIYVRSFREARISGNTLTGIARNGIEVLSTPNGGILNISANTVTATTDCIKITSGFTGSAILSNNTLYAGVYGMRLYGSSGQTCLLTVAGNHFLSGENYGIYGRYWSAGQISGNIGANISGAAMLVRLDDGGVIRIQANYSELYGVHQTYALKYHDYGNSWNRIIKRGTAAPTTGTWAVGDIVYNTAPAPSGYTGWICTTAGTPGTWNGFGVIEA